MTTHKNKTKTREIEPLFECQNCGWKGPEEDLKKYIHHIQDRVAPGEPMPAGECPKCGALCHERG